MTAHLRYRRGKEVQPRAKQVSESGRVDEANAMVVRGGTQHTKEATLLYGFFLSFRSFRGVLSKIRRCN